MSEKTELKKYSRKITPVEMFIGRSPYSIVSVVARIKGEVTEDLLKAAVSKVQSRHTHLRVRIVEDDAGEAWFTSEGVGDIQVEIISREFDDQWISVVQESSQIPFEFDRRPAIRFILVHSPELSELIILCHHIICDGMSLAYLARDLMAHLGDPTREMEVLPHPNPIARENLPEDVSLSRVVKFFTNRINKKWALDEVRFDQEDYRALTEAYWKKYAHQVQSIELSEAQTSALVDRCREEGVTVNSALTTAFVGAQSIVQGEKPFHSGMIVAASLRDRLKKPVGEVIGYYAGGVTLKYKFDKEFGFWENARKLHEKLAPQFTNKNLFKDMLPWLNLNPAILEAIHYKRIGDLVPPSSAKYQKLSDFSKRDDVVLSLLKRDKMDTLDRIFMGTAITNLTRLDFPTTYGTLELDRLIMKPGGGFPLVIFNLLVGAVTCARKMSIVLEYVEDNIDNSAMEKIKDQALDFLLQE